MEYIANTLDNLVQQTAFMNLTIGNLIMIAVACVFLYPEIFADISRRAIKPRLYNTKEKKRLSDILFGGSLFRLS